MIGNDTDKVIEAFFQSHLHRFQMSLEDWMLGTKFTIGHVSQKITLNWGRLCADSPNWIKTMKATISQKSNRNKWLMFSLGNTSLSKPWKNWKKKSISSLKN